MKACNAKEKDRIQCGVPGYKIESQRRNDLLDKKNPEIEHTCAVKSRSFFVWHVDLLEGP